MMARTGSDRLPNVGRHEAICKVCAHPDRKDIEEEWCAWANTSELARQYGLSRDSIYRHVSAFNLQSRGAARAMFDSKKEKENVIQIVWVSPDGREEDGPVFKFQAANRQ